ncbi:MAG: ribosomal-protein-alanine N-acetyltransferase [Crocinitomix sp.]|jgi:ribosomal-protein-alanine N-acetyltransferase
MTKHKVFETERLILKPTSNEDADFFLELFNSTTWIKYIGDRNIRTIENAREFIITKITPQLERLGYSNYTVIKKSDNSKIGSCGLYDRDGLDGIDIGFAFLPKFEKKGYAFEAVNKIIEIASDEFGLHALKAITTKDNIHSQKLLERLGLKLSGTIKLPNDNQESLLYKN